MAVTRGSFSSACSTFSRLALRATWPWLSSRLCWSWMTEKTRKALSVPASRYKNINFDFKISKFQNFKFAEHNISPKPYDQFDAGGKRPEC